MEDDRIYAWLMDHADAPIRSRVARELLGDRDTSRRMLPDLYAHPRVQAGLRALRQAVGRGLPGVHGSADDCLENALPRLFRLGLSPEDGAVSAALNGFDRVAASLAAEESPIGRGSGCGVTCRRGSRFYAMIAANAIGLPAAEYLCGSLSEMSRFAARGEYDFYLTEEEQRRRRGIPPIWRESRAILRPDLISEYGFSFPMVYDVAGMHALYGLHDPEIDSRIDRVIRYISTDRFHRSVQDGYGILAEEDGSYYSMGWDPKYPGWPDAACADMPRALFFAENIAKYPAARETEWFRRLTRRMEGYRTPAGTYAFPGEWLREDKGYRVLGHHLSYGENRRRPIWREIESTMYMALLKRDAAGTGGKI